MSLSTKGNWKQLECVIELVVATAVAIAAAAAAAPPPMWMKDGSSNLIYHSCFELFCVFDMVGTDFLTARRLWRLYEITVCMNETATTRNWVREKKERARKALNTTSNMSIKLKKNTSSYYFFHIYSFVCVFFFVLLFDSYCLSFSCEAHTQAHAPCSRLCDVPSVHSMCVHFYVFYLINGRKWAYSCNGIIGIACRYFNC